VLIDGRNFWKLHSRWLFAVCIATLVAIATTAGAGVRTGRWPGGGSATGLVLGTLAGAIFLFEIALALKKTSLFRDKKRIRASSLRTVRWLGSAQAWMKAHIWLGLLTVPLVVLHSGGRLGGTLTTTFVIVFAVVILSGIWGLFLQNVLPRMLLEVAPAETVYSQIDEVGKQYAAEARRLVVLACGGDIQLERQMEMAAPVAARAMPERISGAARHVGPQIQRTPHPGADLPRATPSPAIQKALANDIAPFLNEGKSSGGHLGSRQKNAFYFDDLRLRVVPELRTLVGQLEELCERRRQLNVQRSLHFWLHNWLWLHLPLSVALLILLVAHVIFALRFG
jgi:hypothetical protein